MSSSNSPCAACKFLRRKCTQGCVFAPYFPPEQPQKFANVHRVFGASNVAKLLNEINPAQREDAVNSLAYEAEARLHDPVYGCVAHIQFLQQRLRQIQHDLNMARKELSAYIGPAALGPMLPPYHSPFGMAAMPLHQQQYGINMGLALTPATNQQILLREQQQHIEEQQLAAVAMAAREQEMLRNMEAQQQHQNEINVRFGNNSGFVDGSAFNNNSVSVVQVAAAASGGASPPSGLALVPSPQFDSSSFQIQQQQQVQQQRIHIQHQFAEHHHQMPQQRTGGDEGRSGSMGPTT